MGDSSGVVALASAISTLNVISLQKFLHTQIVSNPIRHYASR